MSDTAQEVNEQKEIVDSGEGEAKTALEIENDEVAQEMGSVDKNTKLAMDVKVYAPFRNYYEGKAFSVSAINLTGPFDILPRHHSFITLLSPCELIIRNSKGEQKIQISGGLMHVKADKVIVFLDV